MRLRARVTPAGRYLFVAWRETPACAPQAPPAQAPRAAHPRSPGPACPGPRKVRPLRLPSLWLRFAGIGATGIAVIACATSASAVGVAPAPGHCSRARTSPARPVRRGCRPPARQPRPAPAGPPDRGPAGRPAGHLQLRRADPAGPAAVADPARRGGRGHLLRRQHLQRAADHRGHPAARGGRRRQHQPGALAAAADDRPGGRPGQAAAGPPVPVREADRRRPRTPAPPRRPRARAPRPTCSAWA